MIILFYLIFPVMGFILWIMSRKLKIPEDMKETGISRELLKMSLFIYQKIHRHKKMLGSEKVRACLGILQYSKDMEKVVMEYYIKKISLVLLMVLSGSFLAIAMYFSSVSSSLVEDGTFVSRRDYGERNQKINLVAKDTSGNEIGEFSLDVRSQLYTKEEADELFREASEIMEQTIIGSNESLDYVTEDLVLPQTLEGYPFDISWQLGNYDVMGAQGRIKEEAVPAEGVLVTLTATYSYNQDKWQQVLYANVFPRQLSPYQRKIADIKKLLESAEEDTRYEKTMELPGSYREDALIWSEKQTDTSFLLMLLMLTGGSLSFVLRDKELQSSMEKRSNQMLRDYPQLVSQLVLYLGAGMTVRNIFEKLSNNYSQDRKNGEEMRFVYEEVVRTGRELSAGVSEASAYEGFGLRCGGQQYTRLGTLLSQNLRKGNDELLSILEEESAKAFAERMDKIRKAGEEAGTKLLLPMVLMLLIVMVIIMIPAFMSL